jgi:hypothetical protein
MKGFLEVLLTRGLTWGESGNILGEALLGTSTLQGMEVQIEYIPYL